FTRRLPLRFFSPRCADPQHLHSFPTRRSSDLGPPTTSRRAAATRSRRPGTWPRRGSGGSMRADPSAVWPPECAHEVDARAWVPPRPRDGGRGERSLSGLIDTRGARPAGPLLPSRRTPTWFRASLHANRRRTPLCRSRTAFRILAADVPAGADDTRAQSGDPQPAAALGAGTARAVGRGRNAGRIAGPNTHRSLHRPLV